MANDSDDSAPDSRPISVSELLARTEGTEATGRRSASGRGRRRAGREGAVSVSELTGEIPRIRKGDPPPAPVTSHASPASASVQAEDRHQAAGDAAVDTPAPTSSAPTSSAPTSSAPKVSTPEPSAPQAAAPESATRSDEPSIPPLRPSATTFPRSSAPIAGRGPAQMPSAGPDLRGVGSGMPTHPPTYTRDFSARSVAERLNLDDEREPRQSPVDLSAVENANEVTGIIPVVEDDEQALADSADLGPTADEPADDPTAAVDSADATPTERGGFSEVFDDDFDSYRSFSDVEGAGDAAREQASDEPKKRGGLLGLFRRKKQAPAETDEPAVGEEYAAEAPSFPDDAEFPDDADTGESNAGAVAAAAGLGAAGVGAAGAGLAWARSGADAEADTDDADDGAATADADSVSDDSTASDVSTAPDGSTAPNEEQETGEQETGEQDAGTAVAEADRPAGPDAVDETASEGTDGAAEQEALPLAYSATDGDDEYRHSYYRSAGDYATAESESQYGDSQYGDSQYGATSDEADESAAADIDAAAESAADADDAGTKQSLADRSPALAWGVVIAQMVAGLAIGVGLFWGFIELWKWNVTFALILAVLVVFGIVSLAHVLRRSRDLTTTLLALGVGLIVAFGPLALLI